MTTIKAWGLNERAQLGAAYYGPPENPVSCLALPDDTVQVGGSYLGFTAALLPNGTMRMLGGGVNGEMGQGGHRGSYFLPVIPSVAEVKAFAVGGAHVVALRKGGAVDSWGGNAFGTLGNGTSGMGNEESGSAFPVTVPLPLGVRQIDTANGITAALLGDGTVRTWGCGATGALGIGRVVPLSSLEGASPHVVPGLSGVKALACGGFGPSNHVLALLADGTVVQWGAHGPCGTRGDLLSPTPVAGLRNIVAVAAGAGQSFALDDIGGLYAWGSNRDSQLFLPPTIAAVSSPTKVLSAIKAVSAGFQFSLALTETGTIIAAGRNDTKQLAGAGLTGIEAIVAGEHHSFAIGGETATPPITLTKATGGLLAAWRSPTIEHRWEVTASVLGKPGKTISLPPNARSTPIAAMPGVTMAVKVRGGAAWPARTAVAVA